MTTLVIHPAIDAARLARLQAVSPTLQIVNCASVDAARTAIVTAEGFFGKLTPELLAVSTQLRWVQSPTASLEHYLFPELVEHPCQLSNMRGLFSDVIADHVMGLVLCFARNLHLYIRRQMSGRWAPVGDASAITDFVSAPGTATPVDRAHQHLSDLTLGVVGVGAIGAEICRRARSFHMTVLGVDPVTRSVPDTVPEVWPMDRLPDLLTASDYVVIAAPHTPETAKLFNRDRIRQMKTSAVLINIGRGIIVDLTDLTAALRTGEIRGAALDVCEIEPLPSDHPLWRMENVIITPHVAAASPRIAERHLETLLENVRRFVNGEPPATL
ncbi:MAG TPA: D-2-hydroxyacid dehydrogenase, partial [Planctomycetaceae bacterium]|nr:D-2-hydroxyacid dehydrogenase [Planctomycetaceae bacterium]